MTSLPSHQILQHTQEEEAEPAAHGPSMRDSALPMLGRTSKPSTDKDLSGESSDESDPPGFSFTLVQPYVKTIGWEEVQDKVKSYFPFLRKHLFFPSNG